MKNVLITLKIGGAEADFKISAERPVGMLLHDISQALNINIPTNARIQAEPAGRILNNEKSLAQQEVYNGSILTVI